MEGDREGVGELIAERKGREDIHTHKHACMHTHIHLLLQIMVRHSCYTLVTKIMASLACDSLY